MHEDVFPRRISRRKLLGSALGLSVGYLLASSSRPAVAQDSDVDLMWVWMFEEDGEPNEIGRNLLDNGLGIVLKTHDGLRWMSEFDSSTYAVTGSDQVTVLAGYFEAAGIPFHAWAVVDCEDPLLEARMAASVLGAGVRSLFLDPGTAETWKGDDEAARTFGAELRRLQPDASISLVVDARPWTGAGVPIEILAGYSDGLAIKALWQGYGEEDAAAFEVAGFTVPPQGMTSEFVHYAGIESYKGYDLPKTWVADGSTPDSTAMSRFLTLSREADLAPYTSIWRYGTTTVATLNALGGTPRLSDTARTPSASASSGQTYVVQVGDTLSSIAASFDVSVDDLASANDLSDPDMIRLGQELTIP